MIKHTSQSPHQLNKTQSYNQFETFQILPNDMHSAASNKDSLLFSQSRKADETERQIGQSSHKISKQQWQEYYLRSRASSIKKNKIQQTIKQSEGQNNDPLFRYVISSFDPKNGNLNHQQKTKVVIQYINECLKCKSLQQEHKKQISFLTKNNQELYQLNKKLTEQISQFAKKLQKHQTQSNDVRKQMSSLIKENFLLREKKAKIEEKYYQRQTKYLKQKQINLKTNEKELQIVSQIQQCLQNKQAKSKSKQFIYHHSSSKAQNKNYRRIKTEYDGQAQNKNSSTAAKWQGSCLKITPSKLQKSREFVSDEKLRGQIDTKVNKLSQQKKRILQRVAKENLTIKDLQSSQIPKSALNKMGKGNVGKLTLGKSHLGKSSSSFYGVSAIIQKRCR